MDLWACWRASGSVQQCSDGEAGARTGRSKGPGKRCLSLGVGLQTAGFRREAPEAGTNLLQCH